MSFEYDPKETYKGVVISFGEEDTTLFDFKDFFYLSPRRQSDWKIGTYVTMINYEIATDESYKAWTEEDIKESERDAKEMTEFFNKEDTND